MNNFTNPYETNQFHLQFNLNSNPTHPFIIKNRQIVFQDRKNILEMKDLILIKIAFLSNSWLIDDLIKQVQKINELGEGF